MSSPRVRCLPGRVLPPTAADIADKIAVSDARIRALEAELASLSSAEAAAHSASRRRSSAVAAAALAQRRRRSGGGGADTGDAEAGLSPPPLCARLLSPSRVEAVVTRLNRPPRRPPQETGPVAKPTIVDASAIEAMVGRLGGTDVESRREKASAMDASEEARLLAMRFVRRAQSPVGRSGDGGSGDDDNAGDDADGGGGGPPRPLSRAEADAVALRLTRDAVARKGAAVAALRKELRAPYAVAQRSISKDAAAACGARLHDACNAHRADVRAAVAAKYVATTEVPRKKLDKERMAAMALRLTARSP